MEIKWQPTTIYVSDLIYMNTFLSITAVKTVYTVYNGNRTFRHPLYSDRNSVENASRKRKSSKAITHRKFLVFLENVIKQTKSVAKQPRKDWD